MTRIQRTAAGSAVFLCVLAVVGACDIDIGGWGKAKYKRTVRQQRAVAPGSTVVVETAFGSVTVVGAEAADCNVVADIEVRGPNEEEAKETAEQVKIELEHLGNTLVVKAEKPKKKHRYSVQVNFKVTVPKETEVRCKSSYGSLRAAEIDGSVELKSPYGSIRMANIAGDATGESHTGSVRAEDITGSVVLRSSYGSVDCSRVTGENITLKSGSGSIRAQTIKGSLQADTSYGSIKCRDISGGDIRLESRSGSIRLSKASFDDCQVRASYGSVVCEGVRGSRLELHSGSDGIDLAESAAKTMDVSTAYGRITCRRITFDNLAAKSRSGSVEISCSDSAGEDIAATIEAGHGSIDFTAPPGFSGEVDLAASYGSVKTDLPVTTSGLVRKNEIKGSIGEGRGKLHLRTTSGSVRLK
jgi:DUF4097 and DUF4098 domain-containing protein YvlB